MITVALRALSAKLHHDERTSVSLLPVGDGMTLAMKNWSPEVGGRRSE